MMSSVMASQRNSCFGSPLMFTNGSTAIDGLSGRGYFIRSTDATSIWAGLKNIFQIPPATIPTTTPAGPSDTGKTRKFSLLRGRKRNSGRFGNSSLLHRIRFLFLLLPSIFQAGDELIPRSPFRESPKIIEVSFKPTPILSMANFSLTFSSLPMYSKRFAHPSFSTSVKE